MSEHTDEATEAISDAAAGDPAADSAQPAEKPAGAEPTTTRAHQHKEVARRDRGDDRGRTVIADTVVAKIAGIATREIGGVYDLGGAGERMVGKVRDVIPGTSSSVTQGINVEVGEKQAAVDVQIIAEYGVAIHQLANAIRRNVVAAIEGMTGLEVTEVNVAVHDVHLPDSGSAADDPAQPPRVQ
ncbi:Asp23/Gls24 family envelope stress response protein [Gordonia sp. PP30]|uniref:Asp23/Gls24 family envelope stress response protein n=1 Tax=Gordonia sp. PP30 TaxID=2935861 RepID=UPI001FFFD641|nr:Asp23/Gls24 family envelope stress response protein [Gordonia sp. PP30]UQE75271.1 Asp23/Gls24 family envelope stress response protein [Gordonia sp. PP30]